MRNEGTDHRSNCNQWTGDVPFPELGSQLHNLGQGQNGAQSLPARCQQVLVLSSQAFLSCSTCHAHKSPLPCPTSYTGLPLCKDLISPSLPHRQRAVVPKCTDSRLSISDNVTTTTVLIIPEYVEREEDGLWQGLLTGALLTFEAMSFAHYCLPCAWKIQHYKMLLDMLQYTPLDSRSTYLVKTIEHSSRNKMVDNYQSMVGVKHI